MALKISIEFDTKAVLAKLEDVFICKKNKNSRMTLTESGFNYYIQAVHQWCYINNYVLANVHNPEPVKSNIWFSKSASQRYVHVPR